MKQDAEQIYSFVPASILSPASLPFPPPHPHTQTHTDRRVMSLLHQYNQFVSSAPSNERREKDS